MPTGGVSDLSLRNNRLEDISSGAIRVSLGFWAPGGFTVRSYPGGPSVAVRIRATPPWVVTPQAANLKALEHVAYRRGVRIVGRIEIQRQPVTSRRVQVLERVERAVFQGVMHRVPAAIEEGS